jgi:hypothetical protein
MLVLGMNDGEAPAWAGKIWKISERRQNAARNKAFANAPLNPVSKISLNGTP